MCILPGWGADWEIERAAHWHRWLLPWPIFVPEITWVPSNNGSPWLVFPSGNYYVLFAYIYERDIGLTNTQIYGGLLQIKMADCSKSLNVDFQLNKRERTHQTYDDFHCRNPWIGLLPKDLRWNEYFIALQWHPGNHQNAVLREWEKNTRKMAIDWKALNRVTLSLNEM